MDEENNFNEENSVNTENNFTEGNNFNDENLKISKTKKNKLIIVLIVVALIVVLSSGGVYAVVNSNPKVKVLKALKATSEELKNKETITDKIAGKDYLKNLEEKGVNQNMKFTLNSTNLKELAQAKGAGISIDSSIDKKNKKLMINVGGEYKGTSIAKAQFYTDNKKLMLSVPELYNSWFTCDTENIQDQYNNSLFAQNKKLPNQEISFKVFGDDGNKILDKEFCDNIIKGYLIDNAEKLSTIGKNIKVEKFKETKNMEIGGVNQECTGYDVVISGQDVKTFIESGYDYLLQDEDIKKAITEQVKYSYMQQNKKYNSPEAMVDDLYKEMKTGRDKLESSVTFDDVKTTIYIDKKGRAVSIEANTSIDDGNKNKVDVKYSSEFKGKDNIGDIIDMSMELGNNGEKIKIDLDNNTTTKDDTINEEMKLVLSSNSQPINIDVNSKYNTKSGDFDGSADLSVEGQGLTASCNGNANFDKSSKKLALDFDKIDIKSDIDSNPINISLDGSYAISPIGNGIDEPAGEKLEVFKLDKNKLNEIVQEVQKNAMKIASAFR
ncbi:hypothetical protein psyc5s11_09580 [Clostridium gelidum]|uniref:Uncharacterized protein n=1 Tax=Clostridium gelidum TaxID=704125 RepID=A0ABM7T7G9_9CLOT|nr:hypothetical protein [Clostridium gelidum]BCZ44891.1 hypothetical protein psyc5s11_09580 [Clostridium gelidum]